VLSSLGCRPGKQSEDVFFTLGCHALSILQWGTALLCALLSAKYKAHEKVHGHGQSEHY
jgi:hypothetical protein